MPCVLRRVGVGADEQLAVVGDVRARAPDLLPVTTYSSPRRSARVRSEARSEPACGSEKPWHHTLSPREDARQVERALRVAALGDQRRAGVHEADEVHADVRRAGARVLLEVDELLADRQPAPAELRRPREAGEAGVVELALPRGVVGTARRPVVRAAAAGRARGPPSRATRGSRRGTPRPRGCSADPCSGSRRTARATAARSTFAEAVRGSSSTIRISAGSS